MIKGFRVSCVLSVVAAGTLLQTPATAATVLRSALRPPVAVGSAAAYARWLQHRLPSAPFPAAPLFVADPAMNAIVVYDSTLTGSVAPNSVWLANPMNKLSGPVAVTAGFDCLPAGCAHYLWVSNAGNATVTAYALPLTGGPTHVRLFKAGATCLNSINGPFGIAHVKGRLYVTNEGSNRISVFHVKATNAVCPFKTIAGSATMLSSPSGPSVSFPVSSPAEYVFNANAGIVTGFKELATGNVAPLLAWNTGGAATQGTATDWSIGNLWLSSNANAAWPADALWVCTGLPLPTVCPNTPAISGTATGLNFPELPSVSIALSSVFVPNQSGGTVTEYPESGAGNIAPVATFTGLVNPTGTAIENAPD